MKYLIIGWNNITESLAKFFELRGYNYKILIQREELEDDNRIKIPKKFHPKIDGIEKLHDMIDDECTVLILHSNFEDKVNISNVIRDVSDNCYILTVASKDKVKILREKGVDEVIEEEILLSSSLLKNLDRIESITESRAIEDIIKESDKQVAIFLHNNPDPDSFASAMAFEKICEKNSIEYDTYYSGNIGHPENKIIVDNTQISMKQICKEDIDRVLGGSDKIVFLDFAKSGINNILPEHVKADIIIDHHKTNKDIKNSGYVEIRTDVGATSTIMTNHLLNLDINITPILASSLLHGIKVDTDDFTKNIYTTDFKMIAYLSATADKELLDILESPPIDPETVSSLGKAILERENKDGNLIAYAGEVSKKDDISQIVNILSRQRDITTVLVYGLLDDKIYMSVRTKDLNIDIGKKMKKAFSSIGKAGGHKHSAGGMIELSQFDDLDKALDKITENFLSEVISD